MHRRCVCFQDLANRHCCVGRRWQTEFQLQGLVLTTWKQWQWNQTKWRNLLKRGFDFLILCIYKRVEMIQAYGMKLFSLAEMFSFLSFFSWALFCRFLIPANMNTHFPQTSDLPLHSACQHHSVVEGLWRRRNGRFAMRLAWVWRECDGRRPVENSPWKYTKWDQCLGLRSPIEWESASPTRT